MHNASVLGAGLLARTYSHTQRTLSGACRSGHTLHERHQRPDGSWYYGESLILRWVDNFHTAYVLDSIKHYLDWNRGPNQPRPTYEGLPVLEEHIVLG